MTGRQRVLDTLHHREPDRVPLDIGGTFQTGIARIAMEKVLPYLDLVGEPVDVVCVDQQLANPTDRFVAAVGSDVRGVGLDTSSYMPLRYWETETFLSYEDGWNMQWHMPKEEGYYYSLLNAPLSTVDSAAALDRLYVEPDPRNPAITAGLREKVLCAQNEGYAVVANSFTTGLMEMSAWLMGYEAFYMALALHPDVIHNLMDRLLVHKIAYWEGVLGEVGDLLDVVQEGDDLGTQTSLLISPKMYRTFLKPREQILFDYIHGKTGAKLFFHSCGAIYDLIPDLIDVGVDILNPIQFTAAGMDAARLKKEFGRDLVFWGGGIDTQNVLPYGSPDQIREAVKRQKEILAPGGGFVMATVHNIQADVPPENLMAFLEAVREV